MNEIVIRNSNENMTPVLQKILDSVEEGTIIRFENGVYRFFSEGAYTGTFHPSNNASGEKTVIFYISNKKNITIKGNGAKFVFCDRVFPFIAENSENITFEDFSIDFSFSRYCEAFAVEADREGFTLQCTQRDLRFASNESGELLFQGGNVCHSNAVKKFFMANRSKNSACFLEAPANPENKEGLPAPLITARADAEENRIRITYCENSPRTECSVGDRIMINFDENRENDVIFADRVKNFCLDGVNILRGSGMGMIVQMCENVTVRNCRFAAGMHENETIALTADLLMFVQCCGKVTVDNNILCDSLDDAINIHGTYTRVKRILSEHTIEVEFCHHEQGCTGFCECGDVLILSDGVNCSEKSKMEVGSVKMLSDRLAEITFKESLDDTIRVGDFLENRERSPEVSILNNFIKNCPNLRISSAKPIEIKNNTIATNWCGVVIADLMQYWYESGKVYNARIENNVFFDCTPFGKMNGIEIFHSKGENHEDYHENISVIGNKFVLKDGTAVKAENVRNFEMKDNRMNTENKTCFRKVYMKH